MTVVCALRTDSKARKGCRALQVFALRTNFFVGRGDVCERRLWRMKRAKRSGRIKAIGERASHAMTEPLIQQGMSPPVQELPTPYKSVRLYRPPLTRSARRGRLRRGFRRRSLTDAAYPLRVRALRSVYRTPAVGRDHWARRCRNYQLRTNPLVCAVCRFAVGGGMPPPYSRLSLRGAKNRPRRD